MDRNDELKDTLLEDEVLLEAVETVPSSLESSEPLELEVDDEEDVPELDEPEDVLVDEDALQARFAFKRDDLFLDLLGRADLLATAVASRLDGGRLLWTMPLWCLRCCTDVRSPE